MHSILRILFWPFTLAAASPLLPRDSSGKISMYRAAPTDAEALAIGERIGCLDAAARLTLSNCATFTQHQNTGENFTSSTSAGTCGFHDDTEPKNPNEGNEGWTPSLHALRCKSDEKIAGLEDQMGPLPVNDKQYVFTAFGSGVQFGFFVEGLPSGSQAVNVFTLGPNGTRESDVLLRGIWEDV